ncbi:MAG: alkaline phosphatase family protein [Candidatus Sulfotelmatobacter sp.]
MKKPILLAAFLLLLATLSPAQISSFEHIVLVVQENRTPDNMFYAVCDSSPCSTTPNSSEYNIQTSNWLDNAAPGGVIAPLSYSLIGGVNLTHTITGFLDQCDLNTTTGACRMDGNSSPKCTDCPTQAPWHYVDNSTGDLNPYLTMISQYGWANYMFQTNQGPSMPAHQFLFGATSAPSAADDAAGLFEDGNEGGDAAAGSGGCASGVGAHVPVIGPTKKQDTTVFPCFEHNTLVDILPSGTTWKYYTILDQNWNAPVSINHICDPTVQNGGGVCAGTEYLDNVDTNPKDFLTDIGECNFANLTWVIPTHDNSDHGGKTEPEGHPGLRPSSMRLGKVSARIRMERATGTRQPFW